MDHHSDFSALAVPRRIVRSQKRRQSKVVTRHVASLGVRNCSEREIRSDHVSEENISSFPSNDAVVVGDRRRPGNRQQQRLLLETELRLARRDVVWYRKNLRDANESLEEKQTEIDFLMDRDRSYREEASKRDASLNQLRDRNADLEKRVADIESEKEQMLDMVRIGLKEAEDAIEEEREKFRKTRETLERNVEDARRAYEESLREQERLRFALAAEKKSTPSNSIHEGEMMSIRDENSDLRRRLNEANDRTETVTAALAEREASVRRLEQECETLRSEVETLRMQCERNAAFKNASPAVEEKSDTTVTTQRASEAAEAALGVVEKKTKKPPPPPPPCDKSSSSSSSSTLIDLNKKLALLQERNAHSREDEAVRRIDSPKDMGRVDAYEIKDKEVMVAAAAAHRAAAAARPFPPRTPRYMRTTVSWREEHRKTVSRRLPLARADNRWEIGLRGGEDEIAAAQKREKKKKKKIVVRPTKLPKPRIRSHEESVLVLRDRSDEEKEEENRRPAAPRRPAPPERPPDPQKQARERLRKARALERLKNANRSPKLSKKALIRMRREAEKKRHLLERKRLLKSQRKRQRSRKLAEEIKSRILRDRRDSECVTKRVFALSDDDEEEMDGGATVDVVVEANSEAGDEDAVDSAAASSEVLQQLRQQQSDSSARVKQLLARREQLRRLQMRYAGRD